MKMIETIYIDGAFVKPHGSEMSNLINPSTNEVIGRLRLGDETDTKKAIAAAKAAFKISSKFSKKERSDILKRLNVAVANRHDDLLHAVLTEYGAPKPFATASVKRAAQVFLDAEAVMQEFRFEKIVGQSTVRLEPLGVVGIITPWNSSSGFICNKLATAISAGCSAVIKPSEMSGLQTQVLLEAMHEAGLPPGLFNIVNGRGEVVGAELIRNPDVSKLSFTGSTGVGKSIARGSAETLKHFTLELGGKSPNLILDDADLSKAIPLAINLAFTNSGQACIAGTRLLVPASRFEQVKALIKESVTRIRVGDPLKGETDVGPLVSERQFERVQSYIRAGIEEGAELLVGGLGHPDGLEKGNFTKPTVFVNTNMKMRIAKEEIFGPVLSVLTYKTEEEAIEIANDTSYGLQAYISSSNLDRARKVAAQLEVGRVTINSAPHDPLAPFGGYKQSGIGREYGVYGLKEYLQTKAILESAT